MKKLLLTCLIVMVGTLAIDGCSGLQTSGGGLGPTPDITGYGEFHQINKPFSYAYMNCSVIKDASEGMTWNGIEVGKTTFKELRERFSTWDISWRRRGGGSVLFKNNEEFYWVGFQACFSGDTVSAIGVYHPGQHNNPGLIQAVYNFESVYEYSKEFGKPDLITWGYYDTERTVLWADEGIIATVTTDDMSPRGRVESLVIMAPFHPLEANQWLIEAIKSDPPEECVFDSSIKGFPYNGYVSCCQDPFYGINPDGCGVTPYGPSPE